MPILMSFKGWQTRDRTIGDVSANCSVAVTAVPKRRRCRRGTCTRWGRRCQVSASQSRAAR
eukprot:3496548-Rhodomonas_salina.2